MPNMDGTGPRVRDGYRRTEAAAGMRAREPRIREPRVLPAAACGFGPCAQTARRIRKETLNPATGTRCSAAWTRSTKRLETHVNDKSGMAGGRSGHCRNEGGGSAYATDRENKETYAVCPQISEFIPKRESSSRGKSS